MVVNEWKLKKSASCYKCGDATIHDVEIDQYNLKIKCRECGFTRYYAFHMVDIPRQCEV
jgi:predicted nucleic-acid-binding Zn-ribbon protein